MRRRGGNVRCNLRRGMGREEKYKLVDAWGESRNCGNEVQICQSDVVQIGF